MRLRIDDTPHLLPLAAMFLVLMLVMLAYRAAIRRGYAPFALDSDPGLYGGVALLAGASLCNAWPRPPREACSGCMADAR